MQEQPNGDIVLPAGMLETIEKSFDKLPESTYKFIKNFVCEFSTVGILLFNLNKVLYKIKFLFLSVQICYTCVPKTTVNIYVPFHTHILPCTLLIYIQDVTGKEVHLLKANIYSNFIFKKEKPIYDPTKFKAFCKSIGAIHFLTILWLQ